jgi:hypothetical protein
MNINTLASWTSRFFTLVATLLFLFAVAGRIFDFQIGYYQPSRLLDYAAMALLPVIVILLRQIREEVKRS